MRSRQRICDPFNFQAAFRCSDRAAVNCFVARSSVVGQIEELMPSRRKHHCHDFPSDYNKVDKEWECKFS